MDIKIPFYLPFLFAGIIDSLMFLFLSVRGKKRYLYLWTVGWVLFFLRAVFDMFFLFLPWEGFVFLGRLSMLSGTCFFLAGSVTFSGFNPKRNRFLLPIIPGAYVLVALASGFQDLIVIVPVYIFNGIAFIALGIFFFKRWHIWKAGRFHLGFVLIIWGVNELVAAVLPKTVGSSPWAYLFSAFYAILIAFFFIINYYDQLLGLHRESINLYDSLFHGNRAVMFLMHPDTGRILDMNDSALEFYGYRKEDFSKLTVFDLACGEEERVKKNINNTLQSNTFHFESRHKTAEGKERDVEIFMGTLRVEGKQALFSIVYDISARKMIMQDMENANAELEKANTVKQEFMANISHELRTPLNGILGMASLLKTTNLTDEQKNYLEMINRSGEGLFRVISDILSFSDIVSKDFTLEMVEFDLWENLEWILKRFRGEAEDKGLRVTFHYHPDVPRRVISDKLRFNQICINLLSNAIKFTESGWVELSVDVEDGITVINVADSGVGIEKDNLESIFGLFNLGVSTYTKRYAGAGIGLAIVKELTDKLQGTVSVESTPGVGSVFTVRVPLQKAPEEEIEPIPMVEETGAVILPSTLKVLVAEDEAINRMYIEEFLRLKGIAVVSVQTGEEALQKALKEDFDIILMDISMPKMNGLEATREIRLKEKGNTPVIALTAYTLPEDIRSCMDAGMNDFLPKPVDETMLLAMLQKYSS
ncbi:MAG: response regulator [Spirochaetales bacterium]|nr:response regulator [Spirochaetales bacterium]